MIWCVTLNPALDVTYELPRDLQVGTINRATAMDVQLGGKGNNVARTVHALGVPTTAVQILGGSVGVELAHRAERLGISVLAEYIDADSRVCLTLIAPEGSVSEVRPPGPIVEPSAAASLLEKLADRVGCQDWVTISGSLPPGLSHETYAQWVRVLKVRAAGVVVDTSGPPLVLAALQAPSAIVPNRWEYDAVVAHLHPTTTEVVITDGDKGVQWLAAGGARRQWAAPVVSVRNPVGAGDAFLGALVVELSRHVEFPNAIPRAMAVAGASVERLGVAQFDVGRAAELQREIVEVLE